MGALVAEAGRGATVPAAARWPAGRMSPEGLGARSRNGREGSRVRYAGSGELEWRRNCGKTLYAEGTREAKSWAGNRRKTNTAVTAS